MTYEHYEPPVATVTLDAWAFPKEMAEMALMFAWAGYNTGVGHILFSLAQYRKLAHNIDNGLYPFSTDSVMNFAAKHVCFARPDMTLQEVQLKKSKELSVQLLDTIKFFKDIS